MMIPKKIALILFPLMGLFLMIAGIQLPAHNPMEAPQQSPFFNARTIVAEGDFSYLVYDDNTPTVPNEFHTFDPKEDQR